MRYCILKAGRATRATRERIGDFEAMFLRLLSEPDQHWDVFDVENGQFPSTLGDYSGVVITGSPASVYDENPWVRELLKTARACRDGAIPLLGIFIVPRTGVMVATRGNFGPFLEKTTRFRSKAF